MLGIKMTSDSINRPTGDNSRCLDPSRPGELFSEVPMKKIPLTQGQYALVDDKDYEWLMQWKWRAKRNNEGGGFYAVRGVWTDDGRCVNIRMHRQILDTPTGMLTDHEDGDSLNNQRYNIRICTHQENSQNRRVASSRRRSKYKGVYRSSSSRINPWKASIMCDGKSFHLGNHKTEKKAAMAYDAKATVLFKEYACLNFPTGKERDA